MRKPVFTFWIWMRLLWGGMIPPLLNAAYYNRFFPTPRKAVYKKCLVDYFFKN